MKKSYLFGAMASGLLLTACSSDAPLGPDDNGVAENDQTLYVRMTIHGSDMTRAAGADGTPVETDGTDSDFANGVGDESKVNNAYFVFYDKIGNVVGDIVNVSLGTGTAGNGGTVETVYKSTVAVSVPKSQAKPTRVICYINPLSPASLKSDLNTVQTVTRAEVQSANGFPMSNSVFYVNTSAAEPQIAVSVEGKLYDTIEDAEAEGSEAVDIYVERYASKLKFTAAEADAYKTHTAVVTTDGTSTETPVTLNFVADRWALNAEATSTYVVKSFRQPSEQGEMLGTNYTYTGLNAIINAEGGAWNWNAPNYNRSYWAVSPAYFTAKYPAVADDLTEDTWAGQQKYYTLAELNAGAGFAGNNTEAQYFHETTVGDKALDSENPRAAMPAVILVGHYTVSVNGTDAGRQNFYTYLRGSDNKPLVYFEADADGNSTVQGGESMLNRFFNAVTILFKKNADGTYSRLDPSNNTDKNVLLGALEIADPQVEDMAARMRTLQFKEGGITANIYIANGNGYASIGDGEGQVSLKEANSMLLQQVGTCAYYLNGAAYFNIPVLHYGWYRTANKANQTAGATGNISWKDVRVGDFGMVRNHAYSLNVTAITGLGTGIAGENDPIIPPADTQDQYVSYKVNILKWAVVPQQNVELN